MKKMLFLSLCMFCIGLGQVVAQFVNKDSLANVNSEILEEDEQPLMLKFEPDFTSSQEKRRNAILEKRRIIDTLQISEKKKLRLIKEIYRNVNSKRLQKTLLATADKKDEANSKQP